MERRVALISSSYDPYPGGVEEHTRNVARELRARGHEVEVWTVDRGEHLGTRLVDGITVHYLPTPLPSGSLRGVSSFAREVVPAWRAWRRVLRGFRPDVLHVQCFGPNGVYAWALHRATGTPLVLSAHGETFMDETEVFTTSRLMAWGLRGALRDADVVTGCSRLVLDDLASRFCLANDGIVVPNGIDLEESTRLGIHPVDRDADQPPTVFAVGRAVRVKGLDLLIRAFALADRPADARLIVGGDGPELGTLRALAEELGIRDYISFPGRLDRAQVINGMATADVIAVPSRIEAFGIVVLEAWRSETALVATTHGGPADLVTHGHDGLLVDPEDTAAFADALGVLLADGALRARLGRAGRLSAEPLTWGHTAEGYEAAYPGPIRNDSAGDPLNGGT